MMKRLLLFLCLLILTTQVQSMHLDYKTRRTLYLKDLPTVIQKADWTKLMGSIEDGYIIASDLIVYEKTAFDKQSTSKFSTPCTLFQRLISDIHNKALGLSSDEYAVKNMGVLASTHTQLLKDQLQRLERAFEALITSNVVNHSPELAKATPYAKFKSGLEFLTGDIMSARPQEYLAIYQKALASVTTCQQNIQRQMQTGGTGFVAHHIAFQKIDPVYLANLTPEQKKSVASELVNWAGGNPGDYGDFALAASNILSPVQSASRFRLTLPKNPWIAWVTILALVAAVGLYKYYGTPSEDEDDEANTEEDIEYQKDTVNS